jgi:hypothetical protein
MWEPLQRYKALDPASQRIFRRAAILLRLVRWSLHLRGYGETYTSLQKRVGPQAPGLEESLTLWYLLRKQGIPACLRIGVRTENGKFEAHAWVENGGEALNQPEAMHRHYAAFEQDFPEPPAEQP